MPDQQCQADQPADAGEDDPDHAACGPVRSRPSCARGRVRGRTLLAAVRHQDASMLSSRERELLELGELVEPPVEVASERAFDAAAGLAGGFAGVEQALVV